MTNTENKTQPTAISVTYYLATLQPDQKRQDATAINTMMRRVTGELPKMWGDSIIGFGHHHYKYESGREGDWFLVGFAPRKANLVLYIMPGFEEYKPLMKNLGKHRIGKSCLYINKLADVDLKVLEKLVARSVGHMRERAAA
ncbi:MAG: DUF1801 domain-containing protein [Alphaproteobacteria bacterium]